MSYSNTVTPVAGRTTIREMTNGDDLDATDQAEVSQALANRIELNYTRLIPLTTWHAMIGNAIEAEWSYDSSGSVGFASQTTNAGEYIMLPLSGLVDGATLTGWSVLIEGLGGPYAGTPAVKNRALLYKRNMSTGAVTSISAGWVDDPATFGGSPDMDEVRAISESGLSEAIDLTTTQYYILLEHESGANSKVDVYVYGASTTVTRPTS